MTSLVYREGLYRMIQNPFDVQEGNVLASAREAMFRLGEAVNAGTISTREATDAIDELHEAATISEDNYAQPMTWNHLRAGLEALASQVHQQPTRLVFNSEDAERLRAVTEGDDPWVATSVRPLMEIREGIIDAAFASSQWLTRSRSASILATPPTRRRRNEPPPLRTRAARRAETISARLGDDPIARDVFREHGIEE